MDRKPASIVPLIDISGSMKTDNFMNGAKVACDAFIHFFQSGDRLAIVAFATDVLNVYPKTGNLATFSGQQVLTDASDAISLLQPLLPPKDMTNMGDAILRGVALLKPQPAPTGIVLLTDGKANRGPNAVKSADANIRTYCVGLGPGTDTTILQGIINKTGGQYYDKATPATLLGIYFDIIGKAGIGQLVSNVMRQQAEIRLMVPLQADLPNATIGVAWPEPSIGYGPGANEIQVTILDPWSEPYQGPVVYLKRGYVMFPIESPDQGDWTVKVKYSGNTPPAITAAVVDPMQTSLMMLNAPATVRAGTPIVINAELLHENTAVKSLEASATTEVPALTIGEAIDANRDALRSIDLSSETDIDSGEDPDLARFRLLHGARLATEDIFPHHTVTASVRAADKGHELEIPTKKPGIYTVNVVSAGEHPNGGRFQRTSLVTVEVV